MNLMTDLMRVTLTPRGHVLDLVPADAADPGLHRVLDLTPHDAAMRSLGLAPTLLCQLRLGDRSLSLAARSEHGLCHALNDFLDAAGFEAREHVFDLVRHDVRDAMGEGDLFLVGPPGMPIPAPEALRAARSAQSDLALEAADFRGLAMGGKSGWEDDGADRLTARVFLETGRENTDAMAFSVSFVPGTIAYRSIEFELPAAPEEEPAP